MNLKRILQEFYQENFLQIRDCFNRQYYFSLGLILLQTIQIEGLFFNESNFEPQQYFKKRSIMDAIIWILKASKIYPIFQSTQEFNQIYFIYFCFFLSIFIISLIILLVILKAGITIKNSQFNMKGLYPLSFMDCPNQEEQPQVIFKIKKLITLIISIFLKSYRFLIHWTVISSSLNTIYNLLSNRYTFQQSIFLLKLGWIFSTGIVAAFFVLFFFLVLDIFMMFHLFDYQFKGQDYLGKKESKYLMVFNCYLYCSIFIGVLTQEQYPNISLLLGFIITIYLLILCTFDLVFRKQNMNLIKSIILGQFIFLYLGQFLQINSIVSLQFLNLLLIISPPLVLVTQIKINYFLFLKNFQLDIRDSNFDQKLRKLYELIKLTYYKDWTTFKKPLIRQYYSLQLHSLASNHLRNCQDRYDTDKISVGKKCFCRLYFQYTEISQLRYYDKDLDFEQENKLFSFQQEKQFKYFLYDLIKDQYEKFLNQKSILETNAQFSYIYFLFQIIRKPTKAFYEAMNLKFKVKKLSQKKTMIIEQLIKDAKHNFNLMIEKKDLKNQKYNFKQVFDFDENLDNTKKNFEIILNHFKKWYYQLLNQKLNISLIAEKGIILQQQVQLIEKNLNNLYQLNPVSTELDTLMYLFYKYINFNVKRPKSTRRNSQFANKFIQSLNAQVFEKESCIVYISLMNQRGSIQNYTKSFKTIILANDQEIKNQNIKYFMPDAIAQHHDMYLENFIELGRMNIVMAEQRFLILKNKEQFIIPVYAKVRLENFSNDDFGSSALITKINQSNHYISLNKFGFLEETSKNFYDEILKKVSNDSISHQLQYMNFIRIMPCLIKDLIKLEENQKNNNEIDFEFSQQKKDSISFDQVQEGHIIIPKNIQNFDLIYSKSKIVNLINPITYLNQEFEKNKRYFSVYQNAVIYFVKYKIRLMKTINSLYIILEMQSIKSIKQEHQQKALKIISNLYNQEGSPKMIKQKQFPQINCCLQDSEGLETAFRENFDYFRKSQSSEFPQHLKHDIEQHIIKEETNMVLQKQRNLEECNISTKRDLSQQQTYFITADSQLFTKQRESAQFLHAEQESSNLFRKRRSDQFQSKNQIEEIDFSNKMSKESLDQDSSSNEGGNNQKNIHQNGGASSIASSQQQTDYVSKRRMIRDVLFQDHQMSNGFSKNSFLLIFLVLLIVLYIINLVFIIIEQQDIEVIQSNREIPFQLENSLNYFISYTQYYEIQSYLNSIESWFYNIQNITVNNFQNQLRAVLNEQNLILDQSIFSGLCNIKRIILENVYFPEENLNEQLDQLFILKLIGEKMLDYQMINKDDQNLKFILFNFWTLENSILDNLNNSVTLNIQNQVRGFRAIEELLLIFQEVILSLFVIILLPFLLIVNKKKNTILEFFATFPQTDLQQQYEIIQALLEKFEITKFSSSEPNQYELEDFHIKKFAKTIKSIKGSTYAKQHHTKLKRISNQATNPLTIFAILLVLLLFSIISAYFITSYIIKKEFLSNYEQLLYQTFVYDSTQTDMLRENSIQNIILNEIIKQSSLQQFPEQSINYQKLVEQIFTDQKSNEFEEINFFSQEMTIFATDLSSSLQIIFSQNLCSIFDQQFISYLKDKKQLDFFTYEICLSLGLQTSGLNLMINNFKTQLKSFFETISIYRNNNGQVDNLFNDLVQVSNKDNQNIVLYTLFALETISDYNQSIISNSINSHLVAQIVAFVIGGSFLCIFTFMTEKCFRNLISNQINQSKLILTLIPFEILLGNAYVMTYILQESKKNQI